MENNIPVSVYITTYYHEKYIAQAIESVLSQITSFEYEIVISDDCSKDKTIDVVKEYAKKYDNIRYSVNSHNLGLTKNYFLAKSMCRGKYIVDLSGDDYWIDIHKLQIQYDFLEKNPEYLGVCTVVEARADDELKPFGTFPENKFRDKEFTMEMFLRGCNCPLNGMMMRNVLLNEDGYNHFSIMPEMSKFIDDLTDELLIHMYGKIYVLSVPTVAYRVRIKTTNDKNFNSENIGLQSLEKHIELLNNLYAKFSGEYDLFNRYLVVFYPELLTALRIGQMNKLWEIYRSVPKDIKKKGLLLRSIFKIPGLINNKFVNHFKKKRCT